ncbi:MAG: nuclear transport factor 2 family protein [Bacteroidales bacterium]|nr:nuclear transport factor 2 family protein [Bacteroidales bacterium]MCF8456755.1 nuclear transport factor 2 family protein [Bacteroidales bacterium]
MKEIERTIIEKEEQMVDAFNRGEIDKVLTYFDKDVICFSSTMLERIGGLEEFKKTFEYYKMQSLEIEYFIFSPIVQDFGDTAMVSFYWVVALIEGSNRREMNGRGSHLYVKKGDDWKIVHEHFSRAHHS